MFAAWAVPSPDRRSLKYLDVSLEAPPVTCFNLKDILEVLCWGNQWDSIPLLKGQVTEMKFIDLSVVKPGLNLGKRMPGSEQEVRGRRNL